MGGSWARREEEQRGGLGRRCGTLSKGARPALSPRPPGGRRGGQAPGAARPGPWRHPRSAGSGFLGSLAGQGQPGRRGLRRSTPPRGARNGPEGWERPPGQSSRTSEFRNQPDPTRDRRARLRGLGRGGRSNAAASLLWTEGKLERSLTSLFKLPNLAEGGP
ncbi:unnamed protein product [Pipistrellus nathusii]|uniref:Uncharacterized protein n=1 Tax=Pipistrellus nathusii TaxID=59473 RepID=A0ABN9Z2L5_PIPNA